MNTPNIDAEDSLSGGTDNPVENFEPLEKALSDDKSEPVGSIDEAVALSARLSRRTAQASRAQARTLASKGLL